MSATNRSKVRDDHKNDYYQTPAWCIRDFLDEFRKDFYVPEKILDPCAGGDEAHPMAYPTILEEFRGEAGVKDFVVSTIDIREDSLADKHQDFLEMSHQEEYDLIISNPPFVLAKEFVDAGLASLKRGGAVAYLLRLSFLGSMKRKLWWKETMPTYIYVHAKRPSFTEDGGTDAAQYGHFVWVKGYNPDTTNLKII